MNEYISQPGWLIGFILLIVILTVIAIIHTHASKKDRVNRTERSTIENSVSLEPPKEKQKID
ncbi:MAG: hypothetical protein AAGC78_06555 [Cellvibrio sp.]|uniref:hypothetical protein n=1 Tax=Cellvibrio sp. TaxID=1965322 RepID=UPI0031A4021A